MNHHTRLFQSIAVQFVLLFAFVAMSTGLLLPSVAQAEITIDVDARVEVQFEKLKRLPREHVHRGLVRVTNTSTAAILAPLRLVITDLKNPQYQLHNADGFTADGDPYIEIALAGDQLAVGATSVATKIEFSKLKSQKAKKSKKSGKSKKSAKSRKADKSKKSAKSRKADKSKKSGKSRKADKSKKTKKSKKSVKSQKISWQGYPLPVKFLYTVTAGAALATTPPTSLPIALQPDTGINEVLFRVNLQSDGEPLMTPVFLRNLTTGGPDVEMLDDGIAPDIALGDGIYVVSQAIDTDPLMGGDCWTYVSSIIDNGGFEIVSDEYDLCATSFPIEVAESDTGAQNQVVVQDAVAVADEVVIYTTAGFTEADLLEVLAPFGGTVVGTLLPVNLFQVKLPAGLSADDLNQLVEDLQNTPGIADAGPNFIGSYDTLDADFALQHGLQLVAADDFGAASPRFAWQAARANASGITVTVIDSGIDAGHEDFDPARITAEIAPGDNTDTLGHGTQMAGIIGAVADNGIGIAGLAQQVTIESIKISSGNPTQTQMLAGLTTAAGPSSSGDVVLAAFSIFGPLLPTAGMCTAINTIIENGGVVIGSAGNDGVNSGTGIWPARCNDATYDPLLSASGNLITAANKDHYIVVGASNCNAGACASDTRKVESNFGPWLDLSAPGNDVRTTATGSLYTSTGGTSAASAFTAGAAAVLRGCGVDANQVFNTLDLGATTAVTQLPNRINLYDSLATLNTDPSAINLGGSAMIDENVNTGGGSIIGSLTTVDATVCDTHSYTITGGADVGNFSIIGNELRLSDGILDFETKSSYAVTVTSTDFFGQTTNQAFVIDVIDLIEGSTFAIDFDTRQDGTPYTGLGDAFTANEYSGVTIQGNDPSPGFTSVDQVDSVANPGTDISGYHVRVGAFSATPATQLNLNFTTAVTSLSFDFGSPSGGISVEAFDASSISLGVFPFSRTGTFINQAGFPIETGSAVLSGIGNIAGVEIRPALANEGLLFDNLNFVTP